MNIALDIETKDLKVNTTINFIGVYSINSKGKELFKSYKMPEDLEAFKSFVEFAKEHKHKFIMHNGKFDAVRILWSYGIDIHIDHDTMILAYLLSTVDELKENRGKWLGLKYVAQRMLGVENWDIDKGKKTSTDENDVIPYLYLDCKHTYLLYNTLVRRFPKERIKTYKLIMHAINAYKYIEFNGLPINMDKLEETYQEYAKEREMLKDQLASYKDINWNSTKQLSEYLFEELKLPIIKTTPKGSPSTGVAELKELASHHEVIPLLLKHRNVEKAMAFLESWTEEAILHPDGNYYLHSNFNLHGTVTGRTSSSDVNLQQIPRNKKLKSLFSAEHIPGWQLVCLDYSQLELRFAGIVADIHAIKESYRKGEDLHYKMASTVTGKPVDQVTKEERTQAKAANFGFLYGMQAKSFVEYAKTTYGVTVSLEESQLIRQRFFELYPELLSYYDKVKQDLLSSSKQTSVMGREYEVNPIKLLNPYERENIIRPAINFPVQSAGSDYVISGLIEVMNDPILKDNIKIGATVHDSIIGLVREDENFKTYIDRIRTLMERPRIAKDLLTVDIDFPIVVDVEIGPLGKGISLEEWEEKKNE